MDRLRYFIKEESSQLQQKGKPEGKFKALLASDFVGQFEGPEGGSVDYKEILRQGWEEKHSFS